MPKKSTTSRSGTPRNKPKTQKSFELVRQSSSAVDEMIPPTETASDSETMSAVKSAQTELTAAPVPVGSGRATKTKRAERPVANTSTVAVPETTEKGRLEENRSSTNTELPASTSTTAPKGSASARLTARRQAGQRMQRAAASLITAEHFAYVRRDLIFIATLAIVMFVIIIVLHFVPGIGS